MKWLPSFILITTIISLTQTTVSARWIDDSQVAAGLDYTEAVKRAGFVGMRGKKADESLELEAGPHEDQFGHNPEAIFVFEQHPKPLEIAKIFISILKV